MIYAPSRERPMLALKAGGGGDVSRSHVLWSFNNGPDVPTPVTDGTYLYVVNDRGLTSVVQAGPTFEVLAENDFDDHTLSSPAISDGQIFIRTTKFLYCIG